MLAILGIDIEDQYSLFSSLAVTNGFFVGNITYTPPIRPEMGLHNTLDQQKVFEPKIMENMIRNTMSRYGIIKDTAMIFFGKTYALMRPPTDDEIEHDIDHYGIEQVLWTEDYYAKRTGSVEPWMKRYNFPKNSLFGDETWVYVGPWRVTEMMCATFIDKYPLRTSLDYMIHVVEDMRPKDMPDMRVGDGGFNIALAEKGVILPHQHYYTNGESAPIRESKDINLESVYSGLRDYIVENTNLDDLVKTVKRNTYRDVGRSFFEHNPDFGFGEKSYIESYKEWLKDRK
jgi:hypothetical protein